MYFYGNVVKTKNFQNMKLIYLFFKSFFLKQHFPKKKIFSLILAIASVLSRYEGSLVFDTLQVALKNLMMHRIKNDFETKKACNKVIPITF